MMEPGDFQGQTQALVLAHNLTGDFRKAVVCLMVV